jgi:hypothetical protein
MRHEEKIRILAFLAKVVGHAGSLWYDGKTAFRKLGLRQVRKR